MRDIKILWIHISFIYFNPEKHDFTLFSLPNHYNIRFKNPLMINERILIKEKEQTVNRILDKQFQFILEIESFSPLNFLNKKFMDYNVSAVSFVIVIRYMAGLNLQNSMMNLFYTDVFQNIFLKQSSNFNFGIFSIFRYFLSSMLNDYIISNQYFTNFTSHRPLWKKIRNKQFRAQ